MLYPLAAGMSRRENSRALYVRSPPHPGQVALGAHCKGAANLDALHESATMSSKDRGDFLRKAAPKLVVVVKVALRFICSRTGPSSRWFGSARPSLTDCRILGPAGDARSDGVLRQ